jgi:hypothetical protein
MTNVVLAPWVGPSDLHFASAALLLAGATGGNDDTTWPAANRAYVVPFTMNGDYTGTMFWWVNGTVGGHNVDIGIYDADTNALVTSTGSTAQSGTSNFQRVSKSFSLSSGRYYLAFAVDSAAARIHTHQAVGNVSLQTLKLVGCAEMSTAFPLPATFVPAALANTILVQAGFGTQLSP